MTEGTNEQEQEQEQEQDCRHRITGYDGERPEENARSSEVRWPGQGQFEQTNSTSN
jgi:hypothetical protein